MVMFAFNKGGVMQNVGFLPGFLTLLPAELIAMAFVVLWIYRNRIVSTRGVDSRKTRFVGTTIRPSGNKGFFPLAHR